MSSVIELWVECSALHHWVEPGSLCSSLEHWLCPGLDLLELAG